MSDKNDEREQFEAWCIRKGYSTNKWHDGGYVDSSTQNDWEVWQAARQAAPEAPTLDTVEYDRIVKADEKALRAVDALDGLGFTYDTEIGWLPPAATTASASTDELTDIEARQQVAEALGLGRSLKHSFAWSYLLGIIEDCSKDDDEAQEAQAAHAGAVNEQNVWIAYNSADDDEPVMFFINEPPGAELKARFDLRHYLIRPARAAIATSEQKEPQA